MVDLSNLAQLVGDLEEDAVYDLLHQVMDEGGQEAAQAMDACQQGMDIVGKLFEEGEYFVGDLIYAGEIMTNAVDILKDAIAGGNGGAKGRMLICCCARTVFAGSTTRHTGPDGSEQ